MLMKVNFDFPRYATSCIAKSLSLGNPFVFVLLLKSGIRYYSCKSFFYKLMQNG